MILNPNKGIIRKENHKPIESMNKNAKILSKILANQIYKHKQRIILVTKWDLPQVHGWFNI